MFDHCPDMAAGHMHCLSFMLELNNAQEYPRAADKFPTLPVSLVSELYNYSTHSASSNQLFITSF